MTGLPAMIISLSAYALAWVVFIIALRIATEWDLRVLKNKQLGLEGKEKRWTHHAEMIYKTRREPLHRKINVLMISVAGYPEYLVWILL